LEKIARVLVSNGVEFVVIGGQAEAAFGSPRVTYDVDLCHRRTAENLERLAAALRELKPTLRGAPPDLPFLLDARALALGGNFTLTTHISGLDFIAYVEPVGTYEDLLPRAETHQVGELQLKFISLGDLINVKEYLGRPKDQASLVQLLAIRRMREQGQL
jgi:predicted nucleotidyltransferase